MMVTTVSTFAELPSKRVAEHAGRQAGRQADRQMAMAVCKTNYVVQRASVQRRSFFARAPRAGAGVLWRVGWFQYVVVGVAATERDGRGGARLQPTVATVCADGNVLLVGCFLSQAKRIRSL